MNINILKLKNAPGDTIQFDVTNDLASISFGGQEINFVGPVHVTGEISYQNNIFSVKGAARAEVQTTCVNCLEPYKQKLSAQLEEKYASVEIQNKDDESEIHNFTGDLIDIRPEVMKALLMELPMRLVCSEDCQGLCSSVGLI
ncbi:hypothetical protein N752_13160 [Desulforamulus aquiferis]|nr:DUF177 domain-containing protein [Desulforamulus aquiferis]RYD04870.1 hypothetical protein N752_13160 [Desulforamulus aquiferis]